MNDNSTYVEGLLSRALLNRTTHVSGEEMKTRRRTAHWLTREVADLDAHNETACHLCFRRRGRLRGEGRFHDCTTCPHAREYWHFRRDDAQPHRNRRRRRVRKLFRLWFRLRPARCRCL